MARKRIPARHRPGPRSPMAAKLLAEMKESRDRAEANADSARRSAAIAAASGPHEPEVTEP